MKFKTGNSILCKKTHHPNNLNGENFTFNKDETYKDS